MAGFRGLFMRARFYMGNGSVKCPVCNRDVTVLITILASSDDVEKRELVEVAKCCQQCQKTEAWKNAQAEK